jgi:hypothetical protein
VACAMTILPSRLRCWWLMKRCTCNAFVDLAPPVKAGESSL